MNVRHILVPLTTEEIEPALATALVFARRFDAHISALIAPGDAHDLAPLAGEGLSGGMIDDMLQATEAEERRRILSAKARIDAFAAENGLPLRRPLSGEVPHGTSRVGLSFDIAPGSAHDAVVSRARLADMTIAPHMPNPEQTHASETLHAILFDSGRPLVVASRHIPQTVGARLCIAWNGTAEASAALRGVLPIAMNAQAVRVLVSADYHRIGPDGDAVVNYLDLHGITADLHSFSPKDRNVGAGMLQAAHEFGADMLALGAYSHSRLRQLIIGGVTRHVLAHADMTIIMSR